MGIYRMGDRFISMGGAIHLAHGSKWAIRLPLSRGSDSSHQTTPLHRGIHTSDGMGRSARPLDGERFISPR